MRSFIHTTLALAVVLAVPLGCRNIIGVEERKLIEGNADCNAYCETIQAQCTGDSQQYASLEACQKMCATFEPGTSDDGNTDSLACRKRVLDNGVSTGEVNCPGAGPSGHLSCGSKCDVYCRSLEALCLEEFATYQGNCLTDCAAFNDCGGYTADALRSDDSIQCRLFHLNSAAIDPDTHCRHAIALDNHCNGTTPDQSCTP
ncbi:Hypothetical protein A7982_07100 [Minicystis rosea]|nr:Hypothetical protein A7982_07100 [Minicystis rosea]